MKKRKKAVLCAVIASLLISLGTHTMNIHTPALALSPIAETEALSGAVNLYERLSGESLEVPEELKSEGVSAEMLKSVILGYINLDETEVITDGRGISRQDFISMLYKAIVQSDESYAIESAEADALLNNCYDNVYIRDENRIAYAFMMKQGIITDNFGTEPNAELTYEECEALIQNIYDCFAHDVTLVMEDGTEITVGANINTLLETAGAPSRIDKTEYGFEWYVYNFDYENFFMAGVEADRICAFFSNSGFEIDGIDPSDDFVITAGYDDNRCFRFYPTPEGKVDSVLYNPRMPGEENDAHIKRSKSLILLDMINANRAKNGRQIYAEDSQLSSEAWLASVKADKAEEDADDERIVTASGIDVFSVYCQLVEDGGDILTQDTDYITPVGISSKNEVVGGIRTSIMSDSEREAEETEREAVELPETDYTLNEVEEVTTPVLMSPNSEISYDEGDDVVIELAMQAATRYHVEVFDVEKDEYAVNEYIVTDSTEMTLPSDLFTVGRDYSLTISSITPEGESLSADEVLVSYGSAYDTGVEIIAPYNLGILEDDYLEVTWKSDQYSDFYVDLYDQDGELVYNRLISGKNETVIKGIDGGKYYLYVTALRRGTEVEKAQDCVVFTSQLPEPVINEIILDKDETYYYVYEDEDMGLLYFYDEELVDVEENGKTVTKKKIIQKQVRATRGYRKLAKYRSKPASTTGDPAITRSAFSPGASAVGNAIVTEAAKFLGTPYVWGGTSPDGFDCSGLVQYVCDKLGIKVNRVAEDQFTNGVSVNRDELLPGDLIFFERNGYIHHVGIYAGDGMMIHAPHTGEVVKYQSIETDYYRSEYAGARRVY